MRVLVLAGGESSEREVSLNTSKAIADGLQRVGHVVSLIDTGSGHGLLEDSRATELIHRKTAVSLPEATLKQIDSDASQEVTSLLDFRGFDCVFIGLHGGIGEDGTLQALLQMAGVTYTGSGVLASALAMDKYRSKLIFQAASIPVPRLIAFGSEDAVLESIHRNKGRHDLLPAVIKPNQEGSTVGLTIAHGYEEMLQGIKLASQYDTDILIEEFIPGRELTVAILGDQALPVIEIVPHSGFYDYQSKYTAGETEYICPAQIDSQLERKVKQFAQEAYMKLGCSGYARVDFRLSDQQELFCLEVNTLPGMTSTSLVPKAAKAAGITFEELLERIIKLAVASRGRP